MNMVMTDRPSLPTPYPALIGMIGDGDTTSSDNLNIVPVDQAKPIVWDSAPGDVKLGNWLKITITDKNGNEQDVKTAFTSGFSQLYSNGISLVKSATPPGGWLSSDGLISEIFGMTSDPKDQKSIIDNRKRLSSTVDSLAGKGYYFVRTSGASTASALPQTQPGKSAPQSNPISSILSPITSLFSPQKQTYQGSGIRARGFTPASRSKLSQKQKNQILLIVAVGGLLLIGTVLVASVD